MADDQNPQDLIRYDVLTQEALRSVIKKVLDEVIDVGLPGDHHFFISFNPNHPGVRLSMRMREQYPDAMTIVIQHSFWNLETNDTAFEIDLSFNEIPERLRIPYASIISFFDPSVKFGLQFDEPEAVDDEYDADDDAPLKPPKQPKMKIVSDDEAEAPNEEVKKAAAKPKAKSKKEKTAETEEKADEVKKDDAGAEVVSLDAFRKK